MSRQLGTSAHHLALLTWLMSLRSPVYQLTKFAASQEAREASGPQFSPAPPTLPWFSPRPSLQLCLWTGSCFLQFQEGARVAAGAGWGSLPGLICP